MKLTFLGVLGLLALSYAQTEPTTDGRTCNGGYISANCPAYPGVGCNPPVCSGRYNSRFCWQNYQYCENITSQDTCESHAQFGCSYGYAGSSSAGAIAGGVIGGVLAVALIGAIVFFLYRRGTLSSLGASFAPPAATGASSSARPSGSGFWSVSERPSTVYTPVPAQENYGSYRPPTVAMAPVDLDNPAVASVTIVSDQPTVSLDPPHGTRVSVVL
eukprot:TRINITY_DN15594_c0_g1_i1.p1 TRINITY_DN15594_c0_g1~~TRINITY_DN15594_c0_g1_i1.p1  ORF type:complete len:216 (+),score=9.84 TRINITY_DN15594_c0_g1_i1:1-648(+)